MPNNYFSLLNQILPQTELHLPEQKNSYNRTKFEKLSLLTATSTLTANTHHLPRGNSCLLFEKGSYFQPSGIPCAVFMTLHTLLKTAYKGSRMASGTPAT